MPKLIDPRDRTDVLVLAMNGLLLEEGFPALTLRKIATRSEISLSAILNHYGSRTGLLRVGAIHTAAARYRVLALDQHHEQALAFIPHAEEDLPAARLWLEWIRICRNLPDLHRALLLAHDKERALLRRCIGDDEHQLDSVEALVVGLLEGICRPIDPLPIPRARAVLTAYLNPGRTDPPAPARAAASAPSGAPAEPSTPH